MQCIPVLRPFVKDLHTSFTSRRLAATDASKGSTWRGSTLLDKKAQAYVLSRSDEEAQKQAATYELAGIPEEAAPSYHAHPNYLHQHQQQQQQKMGGAHMGYSADAYFSPSEVDLRIEDSHTKPVPLRGQGGGNWPL